MIERRIQHLNQAGLTTDQPLLHRLHGLTRTLPIACAAENGPGLRHGINLALRIGPRAERFAVVEPGAQIPLAVPGVLLNVLLQLACLSEAMFRKGGVVAPARQFAKLRQHIVKEEGQPDTFAPPLLSHQVHAIIPVTAADQRKTVRAEPEPVLDSADTMLVERRRLL